MISFNLKCLNGHGFEGWFSSSSDYEGQRNAGLIACPFCDETQVEKALMAPHIGTKTNQKPAAQAMPAKTAHFPPAMTPAQEKEVAKIFAELRKIQQKVESECDYVGPAFAEEARKIHYGEAETRGIYGQTSPEEASDLIEEGIAITSIPWLPKEQ